MHHEQIGKVLLLAGTVLIVAGVVVFFFGNKLTFFGRLPGDIRIERDNFRMYIPITTMILLSIVLTLLSYIFRKFF